MDLSLSGRANSGAFSSGDHVLGRILRPSDLAPQVVELLKNNSTERGQMEELLGFAGQRLHIYPRASPRVDLEGPQVYLQFPTIALDSAIFPHAGRHPHAGAL